ncbi:MAG: hypothetical protein WBY94_14595 [Polyangiaceae bacterium]|jgi:hypothetical protein
MRQAAAAGGELVALLGNHEIMNSSLDFRYVTTGGFAGFSSFDGGSGTTAGLAAMRKGGLQRSSQALRMRRLRRADRSS